MFYGDGMVTPAMSVLSAVEGLEVGAPALHPFVLPLTVLPFCWLLMIIFLMMIQITWWTVPPRWYRFTIRK
jgi:K+ transporter